MTESCSIEDGVFFGTVRAPIPRRVRPSDPTQRRGLSETRSLPRGQVTNARQAAARERGNGRENISTAVESGASAASAAMARGDEQGLFASLIGSSRLPPGQGEPYSAPRFILLPATTPDMSSFFASPVEVSTSSASTSSDLMSSVSSFFSSFVPTVYADDEVRSNPRGRGPRRYPDENRPSAPSSVAIIAR